MASDPGRVQEEKIDMGSAHCSKMGLAFWHHLLGWWATHFPQPVGIGVSGFLLEPHKASSFHSRSLLLAPCAYVFGCK